MTPTEKELKGLSHAVLFQIAMGLIMVFFRPILEDTGKIDLNLAGGMLVFLGINIGLYIRRYKRVLETSSNT